jgi:hypothetical protein
MNRRKALWFSQIFLLGLYFVGPLAVVQSTAAATAQGEIQTTIYSFVLPPNTEVVDFFPLQEVPFAQGTGFPGFAEMLCTGTVFECGFGTVGPDLIRVTLQILGPVEADSPPPDQSIFARLIFPLMDIINLGNTPTDLMIDWLANYQLITEGTQSLAQVFAQVTETLNNVPEPVNVFPIIPPMTVENGQSTPLITPSGQFTVSLPAGVNVGLTFQELVLTQASATVVSEPSSFIFLVGIGILGFLGCWQRRDWMIRYFCYSGHRPGAPRR